MKTRMGLTHLVEKSVKVGKNSYLQKTICASHTPLGSTCPKSWPIGVNSRSGVVKLGEDGHLGVVETLRGCVLSCVGTSPLETGTQATLLESSPMPDFPT